MARHGVPPGAQFGRDRAHRRCPASGTSRGDRRADRVRARRDARPRHGAPRPHPGQRPGHAATAPPNSPTSASPAATKSRSPAAPASAAPPGTSRRKSRTARQPPPRRTSSPSGRRCSRLSRAVLLGAARKTGRSRSCAGPRKGLPSRCATLVGSLCGRCSAVSRGNARLRPRPRPCCAVRRCRKPRRNPSDAWSSAQSSARLSFWPPGFSSSPATTPRPRRRPPHRRHKT